MDEKYNSNLKLEFDFHNSDIPQIRYPYLIFFSRVGIPRNKHILAAITTHKRVKLTEDILKVLEKDLENSLSIGSKESKGLDDFQQLLDFSDGKYSPFYDNGSPYSLFYDGSSPFYSNIPRLYITDDSNRNVGYMDYYLPKWYVNIHEGSAVSKPLYPGKVELEIFGSAIKNKEQFSSLKSDLERLQ